MLKTEFPGVQHLPQMGAGGIPPTVDLIPDHRMSDVMQMHADLMGPARTRLNAAKAEAAEAFDRLVVTRCFLAVLDLIRPLCNLHSSKLSSSDERSTRYSVLAARPRFDVIDIRCRSTGCRPIFSSIVPELLRNFPATRAR